MIRKPTYQDLENRVEELKKEVEARRNLEDRLVQSEERLNAFFNHSTVGFGIWDSKFRYVFINDVLQKINGPSREEHLGKTIHEMIPKTADKVRPLFEKIFSTGEPILNLELSGEVPAKPGQINHYLVSFFPISLVDGKPRFIGGVVVDITQKKNMETQLQHSLKMDSIGTLAGGIAHDFNNILGVITGNVSFALSRLNKDHELFNVLQDVQKGARRAQHLTHQLLTFSKGGEPIKKTVDLNQVLREATGFLITGSRSKCELNLEAGLWPVEVDTNQFNQAMSNLIFNADQAMPEGGTIRVYTKNLTIDRESHTGLAPGRYIHIKITDQGVGIPDEYLTKIFDPFFTTKQKGSGLGLSNAYSIVRKHGGDILAESAPGKGSNFHLYLPASGSRFESVLNKKKDVPTGKNAKILIMDDDETIVAMAERLLKHMGYETESVDDGEKAIEKYREANQAGAPFDLVILDLTVPGGKGGAQTMPELLKIDPEVKAVVSSGYSNDPVMANYQEYGFTGVVPKPYTKAELSDILDKLFGS